MCEDVFPISKCSLRGRRRGIRGEERGEEEGRDGEGKNEVI